MSLNVQPLPTLGESGSATLIPESDRERPAPPETPPWTVVEAPRGWQILNLRELWRYRDLLYVLAWRDVKLRYKQTVLGAAWAVIQPFMMMLVLYIVMRRIAGVSSGDLPFPLFLYAGLLPWSFFATAIASSGNSVVESERLITKVYFPRLAIPFASVGAALMDFAVASSMLVVLMLYFGTSPAWTICFAPLAVGLLTIAALGIGTALAALNVVYRDFRYVIPFLVQLWLFATPSVYLPPETTSAAAEDAAATRSADVGERTAAAPSEAAATVRPRLLPRGWDSLFYLNPANGLIEFFRASVLGQALPWERLAWSGATSVLLFFGACFYFRRVEASFADVI